MAFGFIKGAAQKAGKKMYGYGKANPGRVATGAGIIGGGIIANEAISKAFPANNIFPGNKNEVYSDSHANIWREFVPNIPLESEEFQAFIDPSRPIEEKQRIIRHFANDTDDRLWRGEDWSRIVKIQEEIVRRQK
jgi:hypothetical protein